MWEMLRLNIVWKFLNPRKVKNSMLLSMPMKNRKPQKEKIRRYLLSSLLKRQKKILLRITNMRKVNGTTMMKYSTVLLKKKLSFPSIWAYLSLAE